MYTRFRVVVAAFMACAFACAASALPQPALPKFTFPTFTKNAEGDCPVVVNPNQDFVTNFFNACYLTYMPSSNGANQYGNGDTNYSLLGFKNVNPNYSVLIMGEMFSKQMSAEIYNSHNNAVAGGVIADVDFPPFAPGMVNPYLPGDFVTGQHFGFIVGKPLTPTPQRGCKTIANFGQIVVDVATITDSPDWVPAESHNTGAPNSGGSISIRDYGFDIGEDGLPITKPRYAIVIDNTTGCAIPKQQALDMGIITTNIVDGPWVAEVPDAQQIGLHYYYNYTPPISNYGFDPESKLQGFTRGPFVVLNNHLARYLNFVIPSGAIASLRAANAIMQVQFKKPTTPPTPHGPRTGNEDMRYMSLSFQGGTGSSTVASLGDNKMAVNPDGYVTIIVTPGVALPSHVTAENGYTVVDIADKDISSAVMRTIAPRVDTENPENSFHCAVQNVPYGSIAYHTNNGGFMGPYLPRITFNYADRLPELPVSPPPRSEECSPVPPVPASKMYIKPSKPETNNKLVPVM